jgi:hypothetical protein
MIFKYGSSDLVIKAELEKAISPQPWMSSWVFPIEFRNFMFSLSMANLAQSDFPCESIDIPFVNPLTYGRPPLKTKDAVINNNGETLEKAEFKIF